MKRIDNFSVGRFRFQEPSNKELRMLERMWIYSATIKITYRFDFAVILPVLGKCRNCSVFSAKCYMKHIKHDGLWKLDLGAGAGYNAMSKHSI